MEGGCRKNRHACNRRPVARHARTASQCRRSRRWQTGNGRASWYFTGSAVGSSNPERSMAPSSQYGASSARPRRRTITACGSDGPMICKRCCAAEGVVRVTSIRTGSLASRCGASSRSRSKRSTFAAATRRWFACFRVDGRIDPGGADRVAGRAQVHPLGALSRRRQPRRRHARRPGIQRVLLDERKASVHGVAVARERPRPLRVNDLDRLGPRNDQAQFVAPDAGGGEVRRRREKHGKREAVFVTPRATPDRLGARTHPDRNGAQRIGADATNNVLGHGGYEVFRRRDVGLLFGGRRRRHDG